MKYDFETIIDRDPAIRGTGKYRIMKDSKGNKPPKGIVPLSVADMELKIQGARALCYEAAELAQAKQKAVPQHAFSDSADRQLSGVLLPVDENPSRLGRSARLDRPLRAGGSRPL